MGIVYFNQSQIDVKAILEWIDREHILSFIFANMKLINSRLFPNFKNHGLEHAFRVSLLALVIAEYYDLSEVEKKILVDAALLHDIGRLDDYYGYDHNYIGKTLADSILHNQEFYHDSAHLNLIKSLIMGHNMNTYDISIFLRNDLEQNKTNLLLLKILKDADILDCQRFDFMHIDKHDLNLNISESFMAFSEYINTDAFMMELIEKSELDGILTYSK